MGSTPPLPPREPNETTGVYEHRLATMGITPKTRVTLDLRTMVTLGAFLIGGGGAAASAMVSLRSTIKELQTQLADVPTKAELAKVVEETIDRKLRGREFPVRCPRTVPRGAEWMDCTARIPVER